MDSILEACLDAGADCIEDFIELVLDLEGFTKGRGFEVDDIESDLPVLGDVGAEPDSVRLCEARCFLDLLPVAPTVWLRDTFWTGGASDIVSSRGCGLRACAIARGPTAAGRKGAAMLARMMLESTVVGKTFSCILSGWIDSKEPKTML